MDREILFRGKRVDNGKWVYGCYVNCHGPGCRINETRHYIMEYPNAWHKFYTATLGQYTGLKDRNGKRIFEGDILSFTDSDEDQVLYTALWRDHRWMVQEHDEFPTDQDDLDELFSEYAEVIGNIHDNPELLRA